MRGKVEWNQFASVERWDHPRVCGEKTGSGVFTLYIKGSPPRMRGKVRKIPLPAHQIGITPAYAGKSLRPSGIAGTRQDHPRVCGEKIRVASPRITQRGSPPRMRGKVDAATLTLKARGITPAYAGKSSAEDFKPQTGGDHPRVCGEKSPLYLLAVRHLGSPPRMRGKGLQGHQACCRHGITPAYAGKRLTGNQLFGV